MTRYFKRYIDSTNDIEINRAKTLEHIGRLYKHPKRVLRVLPLGYSLRVGWAYYKKVNTK